MATVNSSNTTTLYSTTQTTPVKTGADIPQGQVNDTNFTTLYANTQGNATGGGVSSNLLVRGNLRVLGTSDLEGAVTISNSYIMPTSDGANLQVLSTDGNGNATWQNISSVAGYAIQADTATGGADLTLTQVGTPVDAVKFAGGTNITVSRTDANTITIATVADNIPDGTAQGQVLYWNGTAWVAASTVTSAASADRFTLQYDNNAAGSNAILFLRKNYGATPYTTNDGANLAFQLDSDSQATNQYAQISTAWNATAPLIALSTNINNNTAGPFVNAALFSTLQATLPGDLAVNGGDITTTSVTGNLFNATATTVNIGNGADVEVNIGSPTFGSKVQIKPATIVGIGATQAVFNTVATTVNAFGAASTLNVGANTGTMTIGNPTVVGTQTTQNLYNTTATTVNAFGAADVLNMASASSLTTLGNNLSINGDTLKINASGAAADNFIYFNGTNESLKWNQTDTRFEFSDQLYITQTEVPAIFERRVTTAEVNPSEAKGAIRLLQRVTDAASNATDDSGPAVVFGRTSGATTATEQLFSSMGSVWYGTLNKAALQFNWSPDNYPEPTPGVFPTTYTLLRLNSDYAEFFNNSVYVDYANVVGTNTATSITGSNTLVFGSAHGYTAGDRILYQTATANGLLQSVYYYVLATGLTATQCQVSTISGGTAAVLTNGTGLTLTFASVSNQIGINTDTPAYTLDVNGETNTVGQLSLPSMISNTADPIFAIRSTANTNLANRVITLRAESTGTPTVGFGSLLDFEVETSATNTERAGYIAVTSSDVSPGSEDFVMSFGLMQNGATYDTRMALDSLGNLQIDGDFTAQGDAVTINSDKTDTDVYVNFGRVAPGLNAAIRWNATTDSFEWSADSTTWYDFIDVVLTTPQEGQSIIYNGTNWENSSEFEFVATAYRSQFINNVSTAGSISAVEFLKRRASLVDGYTVGQFMGQVVSTTETYTHRLVSEYQSSGNNQYLIQIDPVGNFSVASTTIVNQLAVDNDDLFLNATDITLNVNGTALAGVDAGLTIERGTSGADATFKWIESNLRFQANASIYSLGNLIADGPNIQVNADSTAADSFLYMKGTTEYLKWDNTNTQFEFSDDLEVLGNVDATSITIDDTRSRLDTGNSTTWATATTITLSTTTKNVSKCLFYITDGTDVQTVEALALRNGATAMLTTYGEMYSGSALATFTADVSAGALRIRAFNATATTLTVSILATTLL